MHELIVRFAPKDGDEAERIIEAVEALGFQITDCIKTTVIDGGESGPLRCGFCGRSQQQVVKLVAGPGIYICDWCVARSVEVIEGEF